ncbi:tyrosine-protein phosphatase [Flavobacterium sp. XGLA_31]|uniref:tyrosine-protein phosphatase n=1 Tax=Flavobacterium sp. XGLA_31 TaxID=3447666 RepID=UPI003F2BD002
MDFIPDGYVDIHSHLLPGIDDGSPNIETTAKLIDGLQSLGFSKFISTPHIMSDVWNNTAAGIQETKDKTIADLKVPGLQNHFKAAAEYMMDAAFRELFAKEPLLTLRDNYVLVEMSYLSPPFQLFETLFELQTQGYKPVLAHPERYNFYHHNLNEYHKLKDAGCDFQLNMLSATGYYGPNVAKAADYLLGKGLIDFVGSDVHHSRHLDFIRKKVVLKNHKFLPSAFQNNSFFNF